MKVEECGHLGYLVSSAGYGRSRVSFSLRSEIPFFGNFANLSKVAVRRPRNEKFRAKFRKITENPRSVYRSFFLRWRPPWMTFIDVTFPQEPITGTAPHHRIVNNYRKLPVDYGSLPVNYRHLYGFHYKECLPLPAIYRQGWSIHRRVPPVMKNYRHAGNSVMKSCTSNGNHS